MSYNRVSIKGTAPGGEVWSTGFALVGSLDTDHPQTAAECTAFAAEVAGIIAAWPSTNNLRMLLSTLLAITEVRVEHRDETEQLIAFGVFQGAPILQGGQSPSKAHSSAVCFSLRTVVPGGKGRGRMYWPGIALTLDASTFRITSLIRNALLADLKVFLNSVIAAGSPEYDLELVVRSVTGHASYLVTSLQCGDVPDVQRRRRDELPEQYSVVSFGAPG